MRSTSEVLSASLQRVFDPVTMLLALCTLVSIYLVAKARVWLFPSPVGQNIPRVAWTDVFDFRSLKIRTVPEIVTIIKTKCEASGCKAVEFPRDPGFIIWDVAFAEEVMKNPSKFPAHVIPESEVKENALPTRVSFGDQAQWKAIRGVLKPLMFRAWSPSFFHKALSKLLNNIENAKGSPFKCYRMAQRSTSEVIYEVIFGVESSPGFFEPGNEGSQFLDRIDIVSDMAADLLTWIGLGFLFKSYRKKAKIYQEALRTLTADVETKRKELLASIPGYVEDDNAELFPRLLKACEDGKLPKDGMTFEICLMFLAGQGSTATWLVLALFFAARNPELQEQARSEINAVISGDIPETPSDLANLKFCQAHLDESLRLVPPLALTLGYQTTEPTEIGPGRIMPAGSFFNFFLAEMLRDPNYFDNPNKFDPNRWLTDDTEQLTKMKKAYKPFGFGAPVCPGQSMARSQALTAFAAIIKRFEVRISPHMNIENIDEPFAMTTSMFPDVSDAIFEFEKL